MKLNVSRLGGSWSATPTPFTEKVQIDKAAVGRLVRHHIGLGQKGLFVGGTCGEGPWMSRADMRVLTSLIAEKNQQKMAIAVQVTDNSYSRVLDNIKDAKNNGADIAVIAEPWFLSPIVKESVIEEYYMKTLDKAVLPVCLYLRGRLIPDKIIKKALRHPKVCMLKDSAASSEIIKLATGIRKRKKDLVLLTGCELDMVPYLSAGYDGTLSGGGILIGKLTAEMIEESKKGNLDAVIKLQKYCNRINYTAYGGRKIISWLTGLKYTLVQMGIFRTTAGYLRYPLPAPVKKKINEMVKKEQSVLLP